MDLDLPSFEQTSSLTHLFLQKFNTVFPLFDTGTCLRMLTSTYELTPQHRDAVSWAAINVILALSYRYGLAGTENVFRAVGHLNKAQLVISEVILPGSGHLELLNIQVLVGMLLLLQGSDDLRPASILIATTMRLAHSIGLNDRRFSSEFDADTARQRANVFWLAYIIDKDLSLRLKQPSIQLDDDINLDLPGVREDHVDEEVVPADGRIMSKQLISTSFFQARLRLAVIEGAVYDYLYSIRSQKRDPEERLQALDSVAVALQEWKLSLPVELGNTKTLKELCPELLPFLSVLHGIQLLCSSSINRAHAWDTEWVNSLRGSRKGELAQQSYFEWDKAVAEARDLMVVYGEWGMKDQWNFW